MPEIFDYATTNPASGGENLAGDRVLQSGTARFVPACYLVFGQQDGPYTRVNAGDGLPVAVQGAVAVTGPLTDAQLRAAAVPVSLASTTLTGTVTLAASFGAPDPPSEHYITTDSPMLGNTFACLLAAEGSQFYAVGMSASLPALTDRGLITRSVPIDNQSATVLSPGSRTAGSTYEFTNTAARGVEVVLDMTATTATGAVTLRIQGKDPTSGKYFDLLTGVPVTSVGTNVYTLYPGANPVANLVASRPCRRDWRLKLDHDNAVAMTYSVSYGYLP